MAADAGQRQFVFGRLGAVAAGAGNAFVRAAQGKLRLVVVKRDRLPKIVGVTALAFLAKTAVVHIVSLMAADACERKLRVPPAGMTRPAFRFGVRAGQRQLGLAVIKCTGFAPIVGYVAAAAIGTEVPLVRIIVAVASAAGGWRIAEFGVFGVARSARKADMGAGKRQLCEGMVEQPRLEEEDVGFATLVVGVAAPALRGGDFGTEAVEALVRR